MYKNKKRIILKAIKFLEKKDEKDEEKITEVINEVEQIFLHCIKNDKDLCNKNIINTYIIPYMNLLLEKLLFYDEDNNVKNNFEILSNKVDLLSRVLMFLSCIIKINKDYSYLIISYYVNLLESKFHLIKIIEHLKNIILHILKGLLFSSNVIHNELDNIKRGIQDYVLLKCKIFNMVINFYFNPFLYNHPYKFILIKNLMLIITKEVNFYLHILKNKNHIFQQILIQAKPTHHVINKLLNVKYLDYVLDNDSMKNNYDHIIFIWLEQNIRLFNDLLLFYIRNDKIYDHIICQSEGDNNQNENENQNQNENKNENENENKNNDHNNNKYNNSFIYHCKEEDQITKEHLEDTYKIFFYNKLIYYLNSNNKHPSTLSFNNNDEYNYKYHNINNNNERDLINCKINDQNIPSFEREKNSNIQENQTNHMFDTCEKYMDYEDNFYLSPYIIKNNDKSSSQNEENTNHNKKKFLVHMDCLINNINDLKVDSLIFLTYLMKNIFSLIRQEPFILNFFVKNMFILIERLINIVEVYKKGDNILIKKKRK
ncbi:hypothetical protein PFDG_04134 [Plasmodium falciparum Dd2]|uniref:Uncharacterized protein n=1 Tax=Plasmodium falciparum (isolate Dd2) TaxID=57267 RepID=A0A0L7M882_PLAF4|nr:hypothetical protein PFDG_04134 [Plasmodium falciparum Dd2]